jgi:HSP20 family protein
VDRLTVAAPMPGLEPEDIHVEITPDNRLLLHGALRGALKGDKNLLIDEWSVGEYDRTVNLPALVDGVHANVTYGNGVLVIVLPISDQTRPALLSVPKVDGQPRGILQGNAGHMVSSNEPGVINTGPEV